MMPSPCEVRGSAGCWRGADTAQPAQPPIPLHSRLERRGFISVITPELCYQMVAGERSTSSKCVVCHLINKFVKTSPPRENCPNNFYLLIWSVVCCKYWKGAGGDNQGAGGNQWVSPSVCSVRVYNYGPSTGLRITQQPELFFPPNVCPNCDLWERFLLRRRGWRGCVTMRTSALWHFAGTQHTTVHPLAGIPTTEMWMFGGCILYPRTSDSDPFDRFLLFAVCPG